MQPRRIDEVESVLRNTPIRPRDWRALQERPGALTVEDDVGDVVLVPDEGQLKLYWAFAGIDEMRLAFPSMFDQLRPHIEEAGVDYVSVDLVEVANRNWFDPLLRDAGFEFFAEWIEMEHRDLDPERVPEIPDEVRMRRAGDDDIDRIEEIWRAAYGELVDGDSTFDFYLDEATWAGVLERDGEVIAFALNGPVEQAAARIFTSAVHPDAWGNRYGQLVLSAAAYQLATQDARQATIKLRPDITQGLRAASEAGFRHTRGGLEYRRPSSDAVVEQKREERRIAGVKARFGDWR